MKTITVLLGILLSAATFAEPAEVATIPVRHQPAAALVETLQPLVGETGSIAAFQDRLIVRGTRQQIGEVRALLAELDRPPRRLLIEVRQAGNLALSTRGIGYGVDTGTVRLGETPPGSEVRFGMQSFQTRGHGDSVHSVQAIEGRPALIRAGQSVPVYQVQQQVWGPRIYHGYQVQYRDATTGFVALPRVHGDEVTVEIYQQHESPGPGGRFKVQQASTVLRGGFGQWMTLGVIGDNTSGGQDAVGRHLQTRRAQDMRIDLRVIPVD